MQENDKKSSRSPSWFSIFGSSARRTLVRSLDHASHHHLEENLNHNNSSYRPQPFAKGGVGSRNGPSEVFARRIALQSVTSSGGDSSGRHLMDDHDQQLQRALSEQNVTINKLNLSELELYGRDEELATLQEALLDTCAATAPGTQASHPCFVSISGRTGTGKSRLLEEFKRTVDRRQGLFLCACKVDAKHSKNQQNLEPYVTILDAVGDLPEQLSRKGSAVRSAISLKLRSSLGLEGCTILSGLIPDLAEMLGADEQDPNNNPNSADEDDIRNPQDGHQYTDVTTTRSNQLHYIFRQLLRGLSSPQHPLVLALDTALSCDSASIKLIGSLVSDACPGFLAVATCGDQEEGDGDDRDESTSVLSSDPLTRYLESLLHPECDKKSASTPSFRRIVLGNLDQSAVLSIVSAALRSSEEKTFQLSEIVHQKSNGNPLYVIQFLTSLYDDGLLRYNLGLMQWTWEESQVRARFVMDNVVDLTSNKILRLPRSSQNVLQLAACLGPTFDQDHLEYLIQDPAIRSVLLAPKEGNAQVTENVWPTDLSLCLADLKSDAVIDSIPQLKCYCFVHDLIHDAAFHLIPEDLRCQMQLEVGRRLLDHCRRTETSLSVSSSNKKKVCDQYYFRAVDLSNAGLDLLPRDERLALAKHNLEAGHRSAEQASFASAHKYMAQGLRCLGSWADDPELALSLASGAVEASYCCGDFEAMEGHISSVLRRDDITVEDKVRVYLIRILSYGAQDKNAMALETGRRVLVEMGVTRLPKHPKSQHVLLELAKTKLLLRKHSELSLISLPKLENRRWLQAMSIVDIMISIAYISDIHFFAVMNLRMVRWAVRHGVCRYAPTAFSMYAIVLCGLGELKNGRQYGNVALTLSERLNARSSLAKTVLGVYGFSAHWTTSLRICLKPMLYGYKVGMASGEVQIAMYNLYHHGEGLLSTSGSPLKTLVPKMRSNAQLMREYNQEGVRNFCVLALQFALKLLEPSQNPGLLSGDVVDEIQLRNNAREIGSELLSQVMENFCLQLAYYFGQYSLADRYSRATRDFSKVAGGHFSVPRNYFFRGLTALALAGQGTKRGRNLRTASAMLRQLTKWSNAGNVNCIHMVQLLRAENAAVRGKESEAMYLYWKAINTASRNGYLNDKALAHERAFLYHLRTDDDDLFWAQSHFNDAVQAYCDWNAYQKARQLLNHYGKHFDSATCSSFALPDPEEVSEFLDEGRL